jgi:hypothetical protein
MQRWVFVGMLGAVCFTVPGSFTAQPRGGKPGNWHSSYEAGRAAARQSGKPLVVVFRCER